MEKLIRKFGNGHEAKVIDGIFYINGQEQSDLHFSLLHGEQLNDVLKVRGVGKYYKKKTYVFSENEMNDVFETIEEQIETAIPGGIKLKKLQEKLADENNRYFGEFDAMMDDENNDGVRPPKAIDEEIEGEYLRLSKNNVKASLYVKAINLMEKSSVDMMMRGKEVFKMLMGNLDETIIFEHLAKPYDID